MRYLAAGALALCLVAFDAASSSAQSHHPALALGGMVESGGAPDLGSAPGGGELLRFIPRAAFALGVLVANKTHSRLVLTQARVLEPRRTLVHQLGAQFHRWNPPTCPPGAMCPAYVFPIRPGAKSPHPLAVAPGREAGLELDFRLGSCSEIAGANPAPIARVRVTFRKPDGSLHRQTLFLAGAELHMRMPKTNDCVDPRSTLSVDGPQQYESGNDWTIPGSTGDVCTIRNGRFYFLSRKYQTHISRPFRPSHYERVTLQMHFRGTGTYRNHATVKLVVAKKTVFRSHTPVVDVTKATSREVIAKIEAGRLPSGTTRGIPFHISGTLRCRATR